MTGDGSTGNKTFPTPPLVGGPPTAPGNPSVHSQSRRDTQAPVPVVTSPRQGSDFSTVVKGTIAPGQGLPSSGGQRSPRSTGDPTAPYPPPPAPPQRTIPGGGQAKGGKN